MKAQVTTERIQELALAAYNGDDPGDLTEPERYFFDRAVANAKARPGVGMHPLDL